MTNKKGTYALITGATSGIGYELAQLFAKDGFNLVIVARTEETLQDVADELSGEYGIKVLPIAKDLFEPEAPREIYDEVKAAGITIGVLVNDAGQGEYGTFADTDIQRSLDIIQLNISSLVYLTKLFLTDMLRNNEGRILNLASIASKVPSPLLAVYSATKAFVYSFTQSIINELKGTNVTMTALLPGATETDFFYKAGAENTKEWLDNPLSDPKDVAKDGYEALLQGESKIVSGMQNKIMAAMSNVTPDSMLTENMKKSHMAQSDTSPEESDNKNNMNDRQGAGN